jgi:hypothetical protein
VAETFNKYLFQYYHQGAWWSFTIHAPSIEDAKERLVLLARAQFVGTLVFEIHAVRGMTWLVALICRFKNFWKGLRA